MNYYLVDILTAVGAFLGGGWITSLYKAKPEKTSIELDNMSKALSELKGVIEVIKDNARTDREESDSEIKKLKQESQKRIDELESKVENLSRKVEMKNKAIYSAYDCTYPDRASDCPVLKTYRNCHDCTTEGTDINETDEG